LRVFLLTAAALIGFSANSLLTRSALGQGWLDPGSFTAVRLISGAVTLMLLSRVRPREDPENGDWISALALAGYAVFFTVAYTRIGASVGALILFGSVQLTMIGTGLVRGERPRQIDWIGLALAAAGLLVFTLPGVTAPDLIGSALMAEAGICWGAYSLLGRRRRDPVGATAGNFLRASLIGAIFLGVWLRWLHVTPHGVLLAVASGSLASGVGYTFWYAVLPSLAAWRAAILQLIVPVLTAVAATVLLHEPLSSRVVISTILIVGGVALTTATSRR
jgi:drug/metabolite transporter (DMT)-like permease